MNFNLFQNNEFKSLNKSPLAENKPSIRLRELLIDAPLLILSARIMKTKFGVSILVELDNNIVSYRIE